MSDTIKYEKEILKILDQKLSQEAHLLREKSQNTSNKKDKLKYIIQSNVIFEIMFKVRQILVDDIFPLCERHLKLERSLTKCQSCDYIDEHIKMI